MPNNFQRPRTRDGGALVITLLILVLLTVLILAAFQATTSERRQTAGYYKGAEARAFAQAALDDAVGTIQGVLTPLDDPFGATTPPTFFWAVAPGRLDTFSLASGSSRPQRLASVSLHSGYDPSAELVDLNATNAGGRRAIWPGQPVGKQMAVNWKPVLASPSQAASATNQIVGRYAFWVDDESSKVNVNTADGTELYTTLSYGVGTPSSVRLGVVLPLLSIAQIKEVVAAAIVNPFTDIAEVGRLSTSATATAALAGVRENSFAITEYARSPEFSLFNEPRFYLASAWGGNRVANGVGVVNPGTPTSFVPVNIWPPANRLPLDFRVSTYVGGEWLTASNFPVRYLYPTPLQLTNPNRNSVWPYFPSLSPDSPNSAAGVMAGVMTSSAKISAALGSEAANFAWRNSNSQERFEAARRLALYFTGTNGNNQAVAWPFSQANFIAGKYNLRQIDSIIVQALDMTQLAHYGLNQSTMLIAPHGILGNEIVVGQGNGPKLCELLYRFTWSDKLHAYTRPDGTISTVPDGGFLRSEAWSKGYMPGHYLNPIATGLDASSNCQNLSGYDWGNSGGGIPTIFQAFDNQRADRDNAFGLTRPPPQPSIPRVVTKAEIPTYPAISAIGYPGGTTFYSNPSLLDPALSSDTSNAYASYWGDSLLKATDQNGVSAGVDFTRNRGDQLDPDPRGLKFRKNGLGTGDYSFGTRWGGSVWVQRDEWSLNAPGLTLTAGNVAMQVPGLYTTTGNSGGPSNLPTRDYYTANSDVPLVSGVPGWSAPGVTSITLSGGWNYRISFFNRLLPYDVVPLSSLTSTANGMAIWLISNSMPSPNDTIPFPSGVTVSAATPTQHVYFSVADPCVNKFPGDWTVTRSTALPANTLGVTTYVKGSWPTPWILSSFPRMFLVHNTGSVDMAAMWAPIPLARRTAADTLVTNNISPSLNLPSVGTLQYIRTKMMPDTGGDRGVPFRCLSFAGASDPSQAGIPDWAMLDLVTVPQAIYDRPGNIGPSGPTNVPSGATKVINLTYGGATSGKINPNGSALFPWAVDDASYVRTLPLTAVFADLRYNTAGASPDGEIQFAVMNRATATTLAGAVADYIRVNGPLSLPGQICDIPAVNAYGATVNATRNDIVSQSIGLLETRSSVFSVWVAAQAVKKKPSNTTPGVFETGDFVQSERRYRYTVERYLDLGVDGVTGNSSSPGPDNVVGTLDDPADPVFNPSNPKFKYRILNAQEIL